MVRRRPRNEPGRALGGREKVPPGQAAPDLAALPLVGTAANAEGRRHPENREGPGDRGPRPKPLARPAPGYYWSSTSSNVPTPPSVIATFLAPFGTLNTARTVLTSPGFSAVFTMSSSLMVPAVSPVS